MLVPRRLWLHPETICPADRPSAGFWPVSGGLVHATHLTVRAAAAVPAAPMPLTPETWSTWLLAQPAPVADRLCRVLADLTAPRPPFAGIGLDRPRVMGIVNVTPDSFSDGGDHFDAGRAIAHGERLRAAGVDILDVGGESTRPGSAPVPVEEELRRVIPVVRALADAGAVVSIDTRRAPVMRAGVAAGARIINDVTAFTGDPDGLAVAVETGVAVVLMHMQGTPQTMQQNPRYEDVVCDVLDFLAARVDACGAAGIDRARIAIDPGIGFGKTVAHNLALLRGLAAFQAMGTAVLVGLSRKRFLGSVTGVETARQRGPASLAGGMAALDRAVHILRVHDGAETVQACDFWWALRTAEPGPVIG